ncbi:hypothetical protein [Nocardia sp. NPDC050413]|uniref:hypothetical protein n=1 Tax=Nocardia sp. NPDC050413 TaxID=3155784 RepID=UPI003401B22D
MPEPVVTNNRPINIGVDGLVQVVGEDIQGDTGNDFGDLTVGQARGPGNFHIGLVDASTLRCAGPSRSPTRRMSSPARIAIADLYPPPESLP